MRELRAAARRGDPWLIALIAGAALAALIAALAWTTATDHPPAPATTTRPMEA